LKYLNDDGTPVEPIFYAPIIPMILVNGSKGIGTGFSTDIMCYNPNDIIHYLKGKLTNEPSLCNQEFVPYYQGFTGTITKISDQKYLIKGKYEKISQDKIRITELPVGTWTDDFKEYLETLTENVDKSGKKISPIVKDYDDMSKDTNVDIIITLTKGKLDELEATKLENGCNGLEKAFKLFTTSSNTNMHLFDADDKLKKYNNVNEIIDDYYITRLSMYQIRKKYLIDAINKELLFLSNKAKYIRENLDGTIDLRRKKHEEVYEMLSNKGYDIIEEENDYKYLTKMPMDSVTQENIDKLEKNLMEKKNELEIISSQTIEKMWLQELENLQNEYNKFVEERVCTNTSKKTSNKKNKLHVV
jgi:DNA topoisomerase-2